MPRKYEKCYMCEKFGMIEMRTPNRNPICRHCVYIMSKHQCHKCQNKSYTYNDNKDPICKNCFLELCVCVKCGDERDGNKSPLMLCKKCSCKDNKKKYRREKLIQNTDKTLEYCGFCNQIDKINKYINNKNICNSCYREMGRQLLQCSICCEIKEVEHWENKKPICKNCYKTPPQTCSKCLRIRPLHSKEHQLCETCYVSHRNKDEKIRIISTLRTRLGNSLRAYSTHGKTKTSDEYGINYHDILKHIGPCPGERKDYHIDHIFTLIAFDFNNPLHIKIAFLPENHQWLTKKENLIKGERYNEKEFQEFLNEKLRELS